MITHMQNWFHRLATVSNQAEGYNSVTRVQNNALQLVSSFGFKKADGFQNVCDTYEVARDAASLFKDLASIYLVCRSRDLVQIAATSFSLTANGIAWIELAGKAGFKVIDDNTTIGNFTVYGCHVLAPLSYCGLGEYNLKNSLTMVGKGSMFLTTLITLVDNRSKSPIEDGILDGDSFLIKTAKNSLKNVRKYESRADRDSTYAAALFYAADLAKACVYGLDANEEEASTRERWITRGFNVLGIVSGSLGMRRNWAAHLVEAAEAKIKDLAPSTISAHTKHTFTLWSGTRHYIQTLLDGLGILHSSDTDSYDKNFKFTGSLFKLYGFLNYPMDNAYDAQFPQPLKTAIKTAGLLSLYNNIPGIFANLNAFNPANPKSLLTNPSQFWSFIWILKVMTKASYFLNKVCETGVLAEKTNLLASDFSNISGRLGNYSIANDIRRGGAFQYLKDLFVIQGSITDSLFKQLESKKWSIDLALSHLGNLEKIYLCDWFRKWVPLAGTTPMQHNWWIPDDQQDNPALFEKSRWLNIKYHTIGAGTSITLGLKSLLAKTKDACHIAAALKWANVE